ncbi:MAG: hypothetical protein M3137_06950 [Actinomycetota bacterium]|nr:hypothetical protein [Actinomycetota bacterium]
MPPLPTSATSCLRHEQRVTFVCELAADVMSAAVGRIGLSPAAIPTRTQRRVPARAAQPAWPRWEAVPLDRRIPA